MDILGQVKENVIFFLKDDSELCSELDNNRKKTNSSFLCYNKIGDNMECPKCKMNIKEGTNFCIYCGAQLYGVQQINNTSNDDVVKKKSYLGSIIMVIIAFINLLLVEPYIVFKILTKTNSLLSALLSIFLYYFYSTFSLLFVPFSLIKLGLTFINNNKSSTIVKKLVVIAFFVVTILLTIVSIRFIKTV